MQFVSQHLARRVELVDAVVNRDYARCHSSLFKTEGEASIDVAGGWASFAGLDAPLTQAFGVGMNGPVTEAEFDRLEKFYSVRGSAINLEICPYVDPSVIGLLGQRGYRPVEFSQVLLKPLSEKDEQRSAITPGLTIREIGDEDEPVWSKVLASGFVEGVEPPREFVDIFTVFYRVPGVRCLLVEIDGQPAGGGLVSIRDGVAALATTSTLPEFRGRGAQGALIKERLRIGREMGCDLALVTTHPGSVSHRNVERYGFQVAYSRCKFVKE